MGLQKGRSGNPAGKPKGTVNKTTRQTRELLAKFVGDKFNNVIKAFDNLEDKDKVSAFVSLLKYVVPPARDVDEAGEDAVSALVRSLFRRGGED